MLDNQNLSAGGHINFGAPNRKAGVCLLWSQRPMEILYKCNRSWKEMGVRGQLMVISNNEGPVEQQTWAKAAPFRSSL